MVFKTESPHCCFFRGVGILRAATTRDFDEVGIASLLEQGEVGARGESGIEDDHGLEALLVAGESIENNGQVFGVAHVALEGLVSERETVFVKGDAHGDLTPVIAVLLVFSVFGFPTTSRMPLSEVPSRVGMARPTRQPDRMSFCVRRDAQYC